ncbi:MAG TPA: TolC family protein [Pontiellaceae bacterium]|nr:TolC family protein [Pontiellaceae bacterium]
MKRVLISLLLVTAVPLYAERPAEGGASLTLDQAVSLAIRDNARLRSLHAKTRAMQERPAQAGALPNPMFTYSGMDLADRGSWPDSGEKRYMLQQEFPWFGKRALRAEIAGKDAETMQREFDAAAREVVMTVKETYYDLYATRRVMEITREEEAVLRSILKVAETMYSTGSRSQTDAIKAQTEVTLLKQKMLELQSQENLLQARLNTLLGRRPDNLLELAAKPPEVAGPEPVHTLFARAAENRPEILGAQAQVERYALEQRLMQKDYLPDYKLGLEYRSLRKEDDMLMFTVSVELPIWQSKYRAGVREAAEMQVYSQAAREAAAQQSSFDVQDAAFKLQTARRTLELYRTELIPQAEARFSASEAGYRTGKTDFMDLLESERFLLNAKTMAAMMESTVGMQAARLERATGAALPAEGK